VLLAGGTGARRLIWLIFLNHIIQKNPIGKIVAGCKLKKIAVMIAPKTSWARILNPPTSFGAPPFVTLRNSLPTNRAYDRGEINPQKKLMTRGIIINGMTSSIFEPFSTWPDKKTRTANLLVVNLLVRLYKSRHGKSRGILPTAGRAN
jgi:hypothetical protein